VFQRIYFKDTATKYNRKGRRKGVGEYYLCSAGPVLINFNVTGRFVESEY
jgi:hypothetical protein